MPAEAGILTLDGYGNPFRHYRRLMGNVFIDLSVK